MNYSTYIFDFDGTLFNTRHAIVATIQATFIERSDDCPKIDVIWNTIQKGITLEQTFADLLPAAKHDEIDNWVIDYRKIYNSGLGIRKSNSFGDLSQLFSSTLFDGASLVLATNKGKVAVEQILKRHGLDGVFHIIVSADGNNPTKPNPDSYFQRIKPNLPKTATNHVLVVGDTPADIEYAEKIGADVCWAAYGYGDQSLCRSMKPKYVIDSIDQLPEVLSASELSQPTIHTLVELSSFAESDPARIELKEHFDTFCTAKVTRKHARNSISQIVTISLELLDNHICDPDVLIPVARAGMAMWDAVDSRFEHPLTAFATAKKTKGTEDVSLTFSSGLNDGIKKILVLDTVAATGDTLVHVGRELSVRYPDASIDVFCCYASPEAVSKAKRYNLYDNIFVSVMSETVDEAGWLIPKINGDAGDKLYGQVPV